MSVLRNILKPQFLSLQNGLMGQWGGFAEVTFNECQLLILRRGWCLWETWSFREAAIGWSGRVMRGHSAPSFGEGGLVHSSRVMLQPLALALLALAKPAGCQGRGRKRPRCPTPWALLSGPGRG